MKRGLDADVSASFHLFLRNAVLDVSRASGGRNVTPRNEGLAPMSVEQKMSPRSARSMPNELTLPAFDGKRAKAEHNKRDKGCLFVFYPRNVNGSLKANV